MWRKNCGVARSYRSVDRSQEFLLPPNMAEWLPEDHLVWFVLDVVDQLDTNVFHARHPQAGPGRAAYDPDMLLALLIYAYAVGERSSRRIERLCTEHVAFRVLCAQDAPDHTTLARFRAGHQDAFAGVFAQVLRLCAAAGMVRVGTVSIDGTKIAANAARGANRTRAGLRDQARQIAEQALAEAAAVDATEDASRDEDDRLPPGLAQRAGRAGNIARALAELERQDRADEQADAAERAGAEALLARMEAGELPVGRPPGNVDPVRYHRARLAIYEQRVDQTADSAARRDYRKSARRAAAALQRAEALAAAEELDLRSRSQRDRERRDRRQRQRGGTGPVVNTTDPDSRLMATAGGGSVQGFNAQIAVSDDHLIVATHLSQDANDAHCFAPMLQAVAARVEQLDDHLDELGVVLADAGYFTEANCSLPGPPRLIAPGKNRDLSHHAQHHPAQGPPPADAGPLEQMRHRLRTPEEHDRYKRRSATVEPVIGHLKDVSGLRRFARRGLQAAAAELDLAATALNIRRWHTVTA